MKRNLYMVAICAIILLITSKLFAQSDEICSLKLFPDRIVTQLYWENPGESFVVGLDSSSNSEFALEYHLVNYDGNTVEIQSYSHPLSEYALEISDDLNLTEQTNDPYDRTYLLVSPNAQFVLFFQGYDLSSLNTQTDIVQEVGSIAVGDVVSTHWLSEDEVILVANPVYGMGYSIFQVCLSYDCLDELYPADDLFNIPAFSEQFMLVPSLLTGNSLRLYDFPWQTENYQETEVDFYPPHGMYPIWSIKNQVFYILGRQHPYKLNSNMGVYSVPIQNISDITLETHLDAQERLGNMWLVDEFNGFSIHNLIDNGLKFICWE